MSFTSKLVQWFGVRTDGLAGSGTFASPFNASTAPKFDRLMETLAPGTTVHLHPGDYQTHGCKAGVRGLKAGCRLIGSGIYNTRIKLAPTWAPGMEWHGNNIWLLATQSDGHSVNFPDVHVADLTLDGGLHPGTDDFAVGALNLWSDGLTVERVRVVNTKDRFADNFEAFPVGCAGDGAILRQVRIENHRRPEKQIETGNHGHTLFTLHPGTRKTGQVIEQCHADLSGSPGFGYSQVFTIETACTVRDCGVIGAPDHRTIASYQDTGELRGFTMQGCRIVNACGARVRGAGRALTGARFLDNDVTMPARPGLSAFTFSEENPVIEECVVAGNRIGGAGNVQEQFAIHAVSANARRCRFEPNFIQSGLGVACQ